MTIDDYIRPLRESLTRPELLQSAVERFLAAYWPADRPAEVDEHAWDILGELAMDLEYFEPNPEWRQEAACFYGDERALAEIRSTLQRLQDECDTKTRPCA